VRAQWLSIAAAFLVIPACSAAHGRVPPGAEGSEAAAGSDRTQTGDGLDAGATRGGSPGAGPSGSASQMQSGAQGSVPTFPGAGSSTGSAPLVGGMICDAVAAQRNTTIVKPKTTCLLAPNHAAPAATLEQVLECAEGRDAVRLRLTFDPSFVDNTYGAHSIGWPHRRGHTFDRDLTKSDHAEIIGMDTAGNVAVRFKLDYVSADPGKPSGYGSLGVRGGDGTMEVGDPAWIVEWNTSISRNLNERGYASYTVDSPATDASYTPNPQAPNWDFRVVYEAWVDVAAFGSAGFGGATIEYVHASPAKDGDDTLHVKPGDCPCPPDDQRCTPPTTLPDGGTCLPDDPTCSGSAGSGNPDGGFCPPDDPKCAGTGGVGGSAAPDAGVCPPDDPKCTPVGGSGGPDASVCPPDDPRCTPVGGTAGAPATEYCAVHPSEPICSPL